MAEYTPRGDTYSYVSLNHIRDSWGNSELKTKKGKELIEELLHIPTEMHTVFWTGLSIKDFVAGNTRGHRIGRSLFNKEALAVIRDKIKFEMSSDNEMLEGGFIDETLKKISAWVCKSSTLHPDHPMFTSFQLCDKKNPNADEEYQFSVIKQRIETLSNINTEDGLTYAIFLLILVAILQEKIAEIPDVYEWNYIIKKFPSFERGLLAEDSKGFTPVGKTPVQLIHNMDMDVSNENQRPLREKGADFVAEGINSSKTKSVDMAFHSGLDWLSNPEKVRLLTQMMSQKIYLRVLINSESSINEISLSMQQPDRMYAGFARCIEEWKKWEKKYPNYMEVRISDLPLMHRVYLIHECNGVGTANVTYYTYGNRMHDDDVRCCFNLNTPGYKLYSNEFNFLWNKSGENNL